MTFLILLMFCEFNDENRVLAGQADQNDQADLSEDVVVAAFQPNARYGEKQTHWYDQNDCQGQSEAFVLRRQHEKDQQQTEWIDINCGISRKNSLIGQIGPLEAHSFRKVFFSKFRDERFGL